ncbi:MAG: hypothetical protein KAT40_01180 [Bacteroidales bacterium]|nr:hypothetical protein [Bacteroidales bacterium]
MNHILILIIIIISAGLLGGLGYFYISVESQKNKGIHFGRCIVWGVLGSAVTPLFLQFISKDLIPSAETTHFLYLVVFSICLILAVFSRRFILAIGNKLLESIDGLKERIIDVEDFREVIVKRNSDESEEINYPISEFRLKEDYRKEMQNVINELKKTKYPFRTSNGLRKTTNINIKVLSTILEELERVSIIGKVIIKKKTYYTLLNQNVNVTL